MVSLVTRLFCCCFLLICLHQALVSPVMAGESENRIQLLKKKMVELQEILVHMQEEKLREQPPTESPWQPILESGDERPGYYQYAYLLAPQMQREDLDNILQQLNFIASQDEMKERGGLFVVPSLPLGDGKQMTIDHYNRDLAGALLKTVSVPTALEGGMLISATPLAQGSRGEEPLLFIDLAGSDQILRARIFELLQSYRIFADNGSIHGYIWKLLKNASPQAFTIYVQDRLTWLTLAKR